MFKLFRDLDVFYFAEVKKMFSFKPPINTNILSLVATCLRVCVSSLLWSRDGYLSGRRLLTPFLEEALSALSHLAKKKKSTKKPRPLDTRRISA